LGTLQIPVLISGVAHLSIDWSVFGVKCVEKNETCLSFQHTFSESRVVFVMIEWKVVNMPQLCIHF